MSNETTKSVAVVSDARFTDIDNIFRTLHGKVLVALQEVGQKPTFPENYGECGNDDYKNLHQQARILLSAKRKAVWEEEVKEIRAGIASVIDTYMNAQRAEKSEYDAMVAGSPEKFRKHIAPFPTSFTIPLASLTCAFTSGTNEGEIVRRCKELSHIVVKVGESLALRVQFVPAPTKSEESEEAAA
jgi:hypothetical protein